MFKDFSNLLTEISFQILSFGISRLDFFEQEIVTAILRLKRDISTFPDLSEENGTWDLQLHK